MQGAAGFITPPGQMRVVRMGVIENNLTAIPRPKTQHVMSWSGGQELRYLLAEVCDGSLLSAWLIKKVGNTPAVGRWLPLIGPDRPTSPPQPGATQPPRILGS
ncbi:hypothetical protein OIDMADRAFT_26271 [Oidiodendron maius Zn]|uniref:Protein kinase domain-containing protein n=1 Tax=Oidiodendron maius (strain Zn) TaxID=913774 RepID=A0A0C3CX71_OIDMZ|nr:hypothetical protein OIDMADRAFT_26271 [Oidiodendron maius Zn]